MLDHGTPLISRTIDHSAWRVLEGLTQAGCGLTALLASRGSKGSKSRGLEWSKVELEGRTIQLHLTRPLEPKLDSQACV